MADKIANPVNPIIRYDNSKTKDSLPTTFENGITLTATGSDLWTGISSDAGYGIVMTVKSRRDRTFQMFVDYRGHLYTRATGGEDWGAWAEK